ncbi:MAG: biotin carboxylase N-terminal domain-containing protein, partial [Pseudomonadota bacterium]
RGVSAYLDQDAVLAAARDVGATAIHPGYGFLSENSEFARRCEMAGIAFVGPTAETLALFGDKHSARELARQNDVPIIPGTAAPTSLADAKAFLAGLGQDGALMIKAVAGGGGRGMRPVSSEVELESAYERCTSEALAAFGNGDVFVERLVRRARHIEVQVIGDGTDVSHLWERDCSLQRRRQKIVEIAPAPNLDPTLRDQLISAALRLASSADYRSLGTIEFLVDADTGEFFFIEANPRLQVEHTVTEEVTGHDLVALQLELVAGETLASLGLATQQILEPRGMAMQVRINAETMTDTGDVRPGGGMLAAYAPPSGHGIRVDGYGYAGYRTNPSYDSLLAKLVVHSSKAALPDVLAKAYRALCEFQIDGVPTNTSFLQALLAHNAVKSGQVDTGFVEANAAELLAISQSAHPHLYFAASDETARSNTKGQAGARMNSDDPLAVLDYGQAQSSPAGNVVLNAQGGVAVGLIAVRAPLQGTVISISVSEGEQVARGAQLAVMEAMKMEHVITAEQS